MLRLLVQFDDHATEDCEGPAPTIGAWQGADGEDDDGEWLFAGWCWTHDHFTQGKGTPVGWLPMLTTTPPTPPTPSAPVVDPSKMLRGKVLKGAFGIATIEVDCTDFGPNTIGNGHEILIYNLTKNPLTPPSAAPRGEIGPGGTVDPLEAAIVTGNDDELPGMWSAADFVDSAASDEGDQP